MNAFSLQLVGAPGQVCHKNSAPAESLAAAELIQGQCNSLLPLHLLILMFLKLFAFELLTTVEAVFSSGLNSIRPDCPVCSATQ